MQQGDFKFYLMLSVFWSVYNLIPPALFIFYCYQKGHLFEDFCSFCLTLSYLVAIAGMLCTWLVPDDYNMSQVRPMTPPPNAGATVAVRARPGSHARARAPPARMRAAPPHEQPVGLLQQYHPAHGPPYAAARSCCPHAPAPTPCQP